MIEVAFHYGWLQSVMAFISGSLFVGCLWAYDDEAKMAGDLMLWFAFVFFLAATFSSVFA